MPLGKSAKKKFDARGAVSVRTKFFQPTRAPEIVIASVVDIIADHVP